MVDPTAKKEKTVKADIGASLKDIAKRATQHTEDPKVDVVFVVDVSQQMFAPVAILEKRLIDMIAVIDCLLYTSPSPRDRTRSRMPSSA